uniref:CHORD domain-containing protein n=1 Tax=Zooxanthella nutricula TaxID=1333877 RepID=A0A6U6VAE5_9DINO
MCTPVVPRPPEHVRCKNFGCNQYFDPTRVEETTCVFHKSPPVFHETAKYWSCCPDRKAYDWDEFMKVPGCQRGHHSLEDPKKKVMGGCDVREANAPKRLDDEVPVDPRKKLDRLRQGLESIGVATELFDSAWGRLAAKHGDLGPVVGRLAQASTELLNSMLEDEVNLPD